MTRPTLEVADILRAHGDRFLDRYRSSFGYQQLKAFRAIQRRRTAALSESTILSMVRLKAPQNQKCGPTREYGELEYIH